MRLRTILQQQEYMLHKTFIRTFLHNNYKPQISKHRNINLHSKI